MTQAEQFFYDYAGYSYDPKIETQDEGRQRCAKALAESEAYAKEHHWQFHWEPDWDAHYADQSDLPQTCEWCQLCDENGRVLQSLGCIDDADNNYRRVVQAELAAEAMHEAIETEQRTRYLLIEDNLFKLWGNVSLFGFAKHAGLIQAYEGMPVSGKRSR